MMDVNVQAMLKKSIEEHTARVETAWGELGKLEASGAEQARTMLDEWTKLTQKSLAYGAELQAEWHKAALDATRRAFAMPLAK